MGLLIDGRWHDNGLDTGASGGRFVRSESRFRNWVTADGAPGPTGEGGFRAESGRYHLYVSLACPWAHRTLIFRMLKGLCAHVGLSVVHPVMGARGWTFDTDFPGATGDRMLGRRHLSEVYVEADPRATTRVTVPVLWDRERRTIVSNESADILRMFDAAFGAVAGGGGDHCPEALRPEIDAVNARVYDAVNNGVYKAGFATTQAAYDEAVHALFAELDALELRLSRQRYLVGDRPTEADWRLFTTLVRFDAVYVGHFKCNIRRIADYPALSGHLREFYQWPGIAATTDFAHIRHHYYRSHESVNPTRIVPAGPRFDLDRPHGRDQFGTA